MSNVIGLQTPRASGTNGAEFFIARSVKLVQAKELQEGQSAGVVTRKANNEFLEHDCKPQTKLKLVLLEEAHKPTPDDQQDVNSSSGVPEKIAAKKEGQIMIIRGTLGLRNVKEGEAFDRELQEQRKQERIFAYEERQRERELKEQKKLKKEKEEKKKKKLQEKEQQKLAREAEKKAEEVKAEKRRKNTYLLVGMLS